MRTIIDPINDNQTIRIHADREMTETIQEIASAVDGVGDVTRCAIDIYAMDIKIGKCFNPMEVITEVRNRLESAD